MIKEAAILKDGIIYPGKRHDIIINSHPMQFFNGCEQGFVTDEGEFVGREEALVIAKKHNQLKRKCGNPDELYSEDLY